MTTKLPISLIAIVRNANGRLRKLIEAHRDIVSEVVIVDQFSDDGTYEEALELADQVYRRRCKGTSDPDRDWAFSLAKNPYVLYLDDDEALTDEAKKLLPDLVKCGADAFWMKRQNFVDGVDIESILGEDPQCRLFRKGCVRFPNEIHQYPEVANNAKVFFLDCAIVHNRTMDQIVKANKARHGTASPKNRENQDKFVDAVRRLIKDSDGFTDNWYSPAQLEMLVSTFEKAKDIEGTIVEIGCWEGKSTCALANAAYPETVTAVDTWEGNVAEGENHPSVLKAKQRNVYEAFLGNVKKRTKGNVIAQKSDCFQFLEKFEGKIKFCHIDAAHDYESVTRVIEMLKPHLVKGAVLCGDDFLAAGIDRKELGGGVERAVRVCCPGFTTKENFWFWQNK